METVGEIFYTLFVIVFCMSVVGILYFIFLVIIGLATDIISMSMTAGAIFFVYVTFFGGTLSGQDFTLICWGPGIWVIAPISAFVTVFLIEIGS